MQLQLQWCCGSNGLQYNTWPFWWFCIFILFFTCSLFQTINLAAICTPADYNTRPLDTIFGNFIDAIPVVGFEYWVVVSWNGCSSSSSFYVHARVCNCVCNLIVHVMQIKYCTENNKRLIHFSTCEVYGKTIGSFLPEEYRQVVYQC